MGMFDAKQYLTGKNGIAGAGATFWLHKAQSAGIGSNGLEARLTLSKDRDSEQTVAYVGGSIAGQVDRMSAEDRGNLPIHVRLEQIEVGKGNPAWVLNPVDATPVAEQRIKL